jgi:hypothetical protein
LRGLKNPIVQLTSKIVQNLNSSPSVQVAEDKDDDNFFERFKIGSSFSIGNCENPSENELYI